MKKLLALLAVAALVAGCAAKQPVKEFHPTDSDALSTQGGKGEIGDGSEVDFGLDDEPADGEVKAFHPTDDISSQAQGGKGEVGDGSEVHLDQVNWFKVTKLNEYKII